MEEKPTNELNSILENTHPDQLSTFLKENSHYMADEKKGFYYYFKNVLDQKAVFVYAGGVNYFPFYPVNTDLTTLDKIMESFAEDEYFVSLKLIARLLELVDSESDDWNASVFRGFINSITATEPSAQGVLIVRRNRDIGKGTGTLLSPTDRTLGARYPDAVVLTMYKITGNKSKGWNGEQLWIPNIKLPGEYAYYSGEENRT